MAGSSSTTRMRATVWSFPGLGRIALEGPRGGLVGGASPVRGAGRDLRVRQELGEFRRVGGGVGAARRGLLDEQVGRPYGAGDAQAGRGRVVFAVAVGHRGDDRVRQTPQ